MITIVMLIVGFRIVMAAVRAVRARPAKPVCAGSSFTMLKLAPAPAPARPSLCTSCSFSRVVRGYEPSEELIVCSYAFPPRDIFFAVRECTDFRGRRVTDFTLAVPLENEDDANSDRRSRDRRSQHV